MLIADCKKDIASLERDPSDEEGRKFTLSLGNKIIPLFREESDRWCKAVQPVIDEYVRRVGSKGLAGKEYVETTKEFIEKYKEQL